MSESIDKRIVEMHFDNAQFEKAISTTMQSLKTFEKSLEMSDSSDALKGMSDKLNGIGKDVEGIGSKFSAMGVVAATAINRITNSVMDMGANLVKQATVQPLIDGLDEYNLKLNSIKTIQTNTLGQENSSLEDINRTLAELNNYADKTIYNFAEMTRNIGTFTAAGVDLYTAKDSIQGIANLAAASGSNSQQASVAMYQLSQAISTGTLKLQDWNSVVNAGMGGKFFQNALIETSRALKTGADEAIAAEGSFRESLKQGWATTEVVTQTLKNFTYATNEMTEAEKNATTEQLRSLGYNDEQIKKIYEQANAAQDAATKVKSFEQLIDTTKEALGSGWAVTWEYIIGDLKEAEDLFTDISTALNGVIDGISDARNNLFKEWHDNGGRKALVDSFWAIVKVAEKFIAPIKRAIEIMMQPFSGKQFADMTRNFQSFIEGIGKILTTGWKKNHDRTGLALRTIRRFIQASLQTITGIIETALKVIPNIVEGAFGGVISVVTSVIMMIRRVASVVSNFIINDLSPALHNAMKPIRNFFKSIGLEEIPRIIENVVRSIGYFLGVIRHQGNKGSGQIPLAATLRKLSDDLGSLSKKIGGFLTSIGDTISAFLYGVNHAIRDNSGQLFEAVKSLYEKVIQPIGEGIGSAIKTVVDGISGMLSNIEIPQGLKDFADAIAGIFTGERIGDGYNRMKPLADIVADFAGNGMKAAADAIQNFANAFQDFANGPAAAVMDKIKEFFNFLGGVWEHVGPAIEAVRNGLVWIWEQIGPIVENVKNFVVGAWNTITEAFEKSGLSFEPFIEFIKGVGSAFGEMFKKFSENGFDIQYIFDLFGSIWDKAGNLKDEVAPRIAEALGSIGQAIYDKLEGPLKDLFGWVTNITNPLQTLSDNMSNNINNISDAFSNLPFIGKKKESGEGGSFDDISGINTDEVVNEGFDFLTSIQAVFTNIGNFFKNPIGTISGWVKTGIGKFGDAINMLIDGIKWDKLVPVAKEIASLGASGGIIYTLYEFAEFLRSTSGLLTAIKDIPKKLAGVIDSFKNVGTALQQNIKTAAVLNIAIAIGILVGAIIALSFSDLDKAWEALKLVSILLIEVAGIVAIFGKLTAMDAFNVAGITAFANGMLELGIAVGIMTVLVAILGNMDEAQLERGKTALFGFVGLLAVFQILVSKFPADIKGIGSNMIQIAIAIGIIGVIVTALGIIPDNILGRGIAVLTGISLILGMLSAVIAYVGTNFKDGARGLLELAGVIAILTGVIYALGLLPVDKLLQGGGALLAMIVVLGGLMALITKFPPNVAMEGASSLIMLAAALDIMALALGGLAMIGMLGGDLIGAAAALLMLSLGLAGLVAVLANSKSNLNSAALGLTELAVVIGVLTAALAVLSLLPQEKLSTSVIILATTLLLLVGAFAAINAVTKYMQPTMASMVGFIAMVVAVVAALELIQHIDGKALSDNLQPVALTILMLVVAFAAVAAVATFFSAGIIAIASAIMMISQGVAMLVGALSLGLIAVTLFMNSFMALAQGGDQAVDNLIHAIQRFSQGLWDSRDSIANGIAGIMYALVAGISRGLSMALVAIAEFLGQLLGFLVSAIPIIVESAIGMVAGIIDGFTQGIEKYGPDIMDAVLRLGQMLLDGVLSAISAPINEFNNWLYEVSGGLMGVEPQIHDEAKAVTESASEGAREGNTIAEDTESEAHKAVEKLKESQADAQNAGEGFSLSAVSGMLAGAKDFNFLDALQLDENSLGISMGDAKKRAEELGKELPEGFDVMLQSGISESTPLDQILTGSGFLDGDAVKKLFEDTGTEAPEGFFDGINSGFDENRKYDVTGLMTGKETLDKETVVNTFTDTGKEASSGFVKAFTRNLKIDGAPQVKEAARKMRMEKQFATSAHANAVAAVKAHAESLRPMTSRTSNVMDKVRDEIDSKRRGMHSSGWYIGYNIVDGMIDGLNNQMGSLISAVEELEALAERALAAKAEIASPSKRFARLGAFMGMGLVKGIESTRDDVWAASEGTADAALEAMSLQTDILSDLVDGVEDQPVIRPILDLSDYNATLAGMRGLDSSTAMLYAQSSGLGGRMAYEMGPGVSNSRTVNVSVNLNYDASADANQIVMDIANGLEARLAMEGV